MKTQRLDISFKKKNLPSHLGLPAPLSSLEGCVSTEEYLAPQLFAYTSCLSSWELGGKLLPSLFQLSQLPPAFLHSAPQAAIHCAGKEHSIPLWLSQAR